MWTLLSSQTKQCVIKFTCIFSLGSDAEGCLVQWRTLDSVTTIGEAFIPRIGSEQSIMITILNDLKPGIVYMADAVGVRNDQLTDNERATRIFQVVQDCSTSKDMCTLAINIYVAMASHAIILGFNNLYVRV